MWSARLSSLGVVFTIVFCIVFFGKTGYAEWAVDDDGCRTPDGGVGDCTPLNQCTPMVNFMKTLKEPISQTTSQRIRAYICGSDGGRPKVCCPPGPIIIEVDPPIHRNLYLLPTECGYLDTDDKIVNGEDSQLNEFPWMALLQYKERKGLTFNCGGTIINKNYILTAGHCVTGLDNELVSVRVGEHSIQNQTDCGTVNNKIQCNPPVQDLQIEEVIAHPQYGTTSLLNDIALIRVSTINLNVVNARPVCLPLGNQTNYTDVTVTGWGVTNPATRQTSDILQKVELPIAEKEYCARIYGKHDITLGNSQICAGDVKNKASCEGDSGGPMMIVSIDESDVSKYIQEGVVSFGPRYCGIPGYPGVYTLVKYYMGWILDTIRP